MIRVLHISSAINWRGGEQQLAYMLDGLEQYPVENFVLTPDNSGFFQNYSNKSVTIFTKSKSHGLSLKWARYIKAICKKYAIDLIHCHDSKAHTYAVLAKIFYFNKTPIIVHRKVVFKIKNTLPTIYKYKKVNHIICISKAVEKVVLQTLPKPKTSVVYSAISLNNTKIDFDLRKNYNIPKEHKIVGNIGALTYEKDHKTFLKVAKKMLEKDSKLHFVIVGSGKLEKELKADAQNLKIDKNVIFTGFINNAKTLTKQFDLFLFTSTSEGLGTVVLDAFLYKIPVITVKNGGCQELIINEKNGFICDVQDINCLVEKSFRVLNDKKLQENLVLHAHDFLIKNFVISTMAEKLYDLYKKIKNE